MLVDTTFLIKDPEIIKGLADGSMQRYGSVIRWAAGRPTGGQIVGTLAEAPGLTSKLWGVPFSPILEGIEKTLSSVMGLTQIPDADAEIGLYILPPIE
ncbi:hypothetical protein [Gloeocapsopsis dulcis]|uniref:hypothetical protein n=1 Tax=Gloeocapsopsis dulcis TaxID=2859516 RepID=UPI0018C663A2|nr:hypothetical protein [Gloeocapsopsis dulcis]WNN89473.1 hypothetical protein P0S91_25115 [Gloeocapsopsis dulcis]